MGRLILDFVLRLFGGGIAKTAVDGLLAAQQQRLAAQNESERLVADQNIAFWQRQIDAAREGSERQAVKMNQPVFWFIMCAALLPGLGTFLLLGVYNVLWHKAGIWPQPWNIAAFPPPYDAWAQMSIEWVFDPVKLAATTATAAAGGYLTGRR